MFSIGAVFYELLSYRNAFAGDAPSTVMHKILYGRPEQLEIVCPNLDPALVTIVTRCIEKQPENRYPDLGAVRSALAAVSRRIQVADEAAEDDQTLPVVMPGHRIAARPDAGVGRLAQRQRRHGADAPARRTDARQADPGAHRERTPRARAG